MDGYSPPLAEACCYGSRIGMRVRKPKTSRPPRASTHSKGTRPEQSEPGPNAAPPASSFGESEVRHLVREATERISPERFIFMMMRAHDALKSNRTRQAEGILAECRLKSFQRLASAALRLARSG